MTPRASALPRLLCLALVPLLVSGCTRDRILPPLEVHKIRIDWAALNLPTRELRGVRVQGVVFTPAQWPLQASLHRLVRGDLAGVVESFDLRFEPSRLPEGALQDLFDEGYLPAYVHVENTAAEPRWLLIEQLGLELDGDQYWHASPPELVPHRITEMDWERTGASLAIIVAWLMVLMLIAALTGGRGGGNVPGPNVPVPRTMVHDGAARVSPQSQDDPAFQLFLASGPLQPGAARTGLVLFKIERAVGDWRTARLVVF